MLGGSVPLRATGLCLCVIGRVCLFCLLAYSSSLYHLCMVVSLLKRITQRNSGSEKLGLPSWLGRLNQARSTDCALLWKMMMDAQKRRSTALCKDKCREGTAPVWHPGEKCENYRLVLTQRQNPLIDIRQVGFPLHLLGGKNNVDIHF